MHKGQSLKWVVMIYWDQSSLIWLGFLSMESMSNTKRLTRTQKWLWVASTKRKEESLSRFFVLFWLLTSLVKIETGTCESCDLSWVLSMCVLSSVMTLSWLITRLLSDIRKILLLLPSPWWNQSWNLHYCVFEWDRMEASKWDIFKNLG